MKVIYLIKAIVDGREQCFPINECQFFHDCVVHDVYDDHVGQQTTVIPNADWSWVEETISPSNLTYEQYLNKEKYLQTKLFDVNDETSVASRAQILFVEPEWADADFISNDNMRKVLCDESLLTELEKLGVLDIEDFKYNLEADGQDFDSDEACYVLRHAILDRALECPNKNVLEIIGCSTASYVLYKQEVWKIRQQRSDFFAEQRNILEREYINSFNKP